VNTGMRVVDATGEDTGVVTAVQMPAPTYARTRRAGTAENLMDTGYLRIDATGFLASDAYAGGDQVEGPSRARPAWSISGSPPTSCSAP
jgi:hypothetical protein